MFKKRFFSVLMRGIFVATLLLNCAAKSTPDINMRVALNLNIEAVQFVDNRFNF